MHITNGDILVALNAIGWGIHFTVNHVKGKKNASKIVDAVLKEVKNFVPDIANITNDVVDGIKHLIQIPAVAVKVAPVKHEVSKLESDLLHSRLLSAAAIALHGLQKRLDGLTEADKLAMVEYVRSMIPLDMLQVTNDQIIGAINEAQKIADDAAKNPLFLTAAALSDVIQTFKDKQAQKDENVSETKIEAPETKPTGTPEQPVQVQ